MCASTVVMLDTLCSEVVWRVLDTNIIRHFPFYFPSSGSPCAITFQLDSTYVDAVDWGGGGGESLRCSENAFCFYANRLLIVWTEKESLRIHVDKLSFLFLYLIVRPCQQRILRNVGGKMTAESRIGRDLEGRIFGLFEVITRMFFMFYWPCFST
jgi:hypothetical protein